MRHLGARAQRCSQRAMRHLDPAAARHLRARVWPRDPQCVPRVLLDADPREERSVGQLGGGHAHASLGEQIERPAGEKR
eukprot:scaffold131640_cov26-Tisochrysis_lutea.AAC.3